MVLNTMFTNQKQVYTGQSKIIVGFNTEKFLIEFTGRFSLYFLANCKNNIRKI